MSAPTFNKFKSTTIYGNFNNVDFTDSSGAIITSASSYFQRNLTISGDVTCSGIIKAKKLYYNNVDIDLTYVSNTTLTSYASLFQPVFKGNIDLTIIDPIVNPYTFTIANGAGTINMNTYNNGSYPVRIKATNLQLSKNNGIAYYDVLTSNTGALLSGATFTGNVIGLTQLSTDNSTKFATTAFVKAQNYITSNPDLSPYALLSGATFTGTINCNNGLTTAAGKDVHISCNNTFPTTNSGGKTGLGFYWNQSGGVGEVNLLCYGQGGTGGLNIWNSNVSNVPTKLVEFYPSGTTFETIVDIKRTLNLVQQSSVNSAVLQFCTETEAARATMYSSVGDSVFSFDILSAYNTNGFQWYSRGPSKLLMKLSTTGYLQVPNAQIGMNSNAGDIVLQIGNGSTDFANMSVNGYTLNISQNVSTGNLKCNGLLDSNGYTGLAGQIPTTNGGGGWGWLNAPTPTSTNSVFGTQQIIN